VIVAQISDPHITVEGGKADRLYETAAHLRRAVDHLNNLPAPPDAVLVTGDCADRGALPEYERLRELLRPLRAPVYLIPGNHDDRLTLRQVFGDQGAQPMADFIQYTVDAGPLRLLALDSLVPGEDGGLLCPARLEWLAARLREAPSRPTLLFMHHPPFATGLRSLDGMGLAGADALGAIVAAAPQVERVVAGHVHAAMQRRFYGSLAVTCPSTAHQVLLDLARPERLAVHMGPPACLLHVWSEATGLVTHTSAIAAPGPVRELYDGERWLP
jgi:3',5'-cyclic AMP phosphodiesterase CpdA